MSNSISRRTFLGGAVATASLSATGKLPSRTLGRTGEQPSILAFGCGSRLGMYETQDRAVEVLNLALDSGITYLDTAQVYGGGNSETWVGEVMKTRRKGVFLATKTVARTADDVLRRIDTSLTKLNTDQVDLLHLHSLQGPEDLEKVEKNKVMEALYKVREQKMAKYIGITSHTDPEVLATALDRYDVDCTQMALNAALQGMQNGKGRMDLNPAMTTNFEKIALPVAKRKHIGVIAMKVFGQMHIMPREDDFEAAARLLRYSLSLPVAVAVIGCPKHEHLTRNVETARSFQAMEPTEMRRYSDQLSERYKQALDRVFEDHIDA